DTVFGSSTTEGYTLDQGVTVTDRRTFMKVNVAPYVTAVKKYRVGSVMPSFSSVDWKEDGVGNPVKMHAHKELLTGVLKGKIGFDGFVISDWAAIQQIPGDYATQVRTSVNAGVDMFMEPYSPPPFVDTLLAEVPAGRENSSRRDDSVRRVPEPTCELGLSDREYTDRT